jgi:nicotinamidase-related amidase
VVASTRLLLRAAKVLELPILMTTHYLKGLGPAHADVLELTPWVMPFDKVTFSCFGSSEFSQALAATERRTLLLCGVETHICVLQTGLDALARDHEVHLATDATSSRTAANAQLGQHRLERAGAILTSAETAVYELLRTSAAPAFKSLLPYLK